MAVTPVPDVAVGLVFGIAGITSAWQIEDFTLPGMAGDVISASHQGTTPPYMDFVAADLADGGAFECTVQHDQDYDYWADYGITGACVVTCPSGTLIGFSGIFQSYTPQSATLNEKMLADVVVKLTGAVTVTDAA